MQTHNIEQTSYLLVCGDQRNVKLDELHPEMFRASVQVLGEIWTDDGAQSYAFFCVASRAAVEVISNCAFKFLVSMVVCDFVYLHLTVRPQLCAPCKSLLYSPG